jgi:trehalose-6-phosphatase
MDGGKYDFVLAPGNDKTDEDMFRVTDQLKVVHLLEKLPREF